MFHISAADSGAACCRHSRKFSCCEGALIDVDLNACCLHLQAVFLGLDIVVPLMTGELLAVPKLARLYFGLLSYMLEIWPARVAELPGALSVSFLLHVVHPGSHCSH